MLAAIDAGSNTLRLLIGRVIDGKVVPELYMRRICRLAGGATLEGGLTPEARERTLLAFQEFAETCRSYNVEQVRAVGTAAFRQAVNGAAFVREVRASTLLPLEIISGTVEAEMMTIGVLSALEPVPEHALVIDIGGGSTEFVLCINQRVVWSSSLSLGVVRLTEDYQMAAERQRAVADLLAGLFNSLNDACAANRIDSKSLTLVGTAGTVTTLAALDLQMDSYDWQKINNYRMSLAKLQQWQKKLDPMSLEERESLPGMEAGRGDLIMAGIDIMLCLLHSLGKASFTTSDFGILEGLMLSMSGSE